MAGRGPPGRDRPPVIRDRHLNVQRRADLVRDVTRSPPPASWAIMKSSMPALPRFRGEVPEPRPGLRAGHIPAPKACPLASFTPRTAR